MSKPREYVSVKKETLREIIYLVDETTKLSEQLEEDNQSLRVSLHSLISDAKNIRKVRDPMHNLLSTQEIEKEKRAKRIKLISHDK